jgi:hypothetical protein
MKACPLKFPWHFPCSRRRWKFYAKWLWQSMKPHGWTDEHSFTYIINILQYVTNIWVPSMCPIVSIECLKVLKVRICNQPLEIAQVVNFQNCRFYYKKKKMKKKMFSFLGSNPKILFQPTRRISSNIFKIFDQIEYKLILFEVSWWVFLHLAK